MAKLSISKAWDETKDVLGRDGRLLLIVAAALLILPQAALGVFAPSRPNEVSNGFFILLAITLLTALIAQITLIRLAIPPSSTVGAAIKTGVRRLFPLLIALVIVLILVTLAAVAILAVLLAAGAVDPPVASEPPPAWLAMVLVFTGLAIFAIFQLIFPVAAGEDGGPMKLLSRAWTLGTNSYWRLVAFLAIVWVGMFMFWIIGQLIPGLAVTAMSGGAPEQGSLGAGIVSLLSAAVQAAWTVVTSVMLARIYTQVLDGGEAEASVPRTQEN